MKDLRPESIKSSRKSLRYLELGRESVGTAGQLPCNRVPFT